jgi:hypothetical protein
LIAAAENAEKTANKSKGEDSNQMQEISEVCVSEIQKSPS